MKAIETAGGAKVRVSPACRCIPVMQMDGARLLPEIRGALRKLAKRLTIKDIAYYFETTKPDHLQAADTSKA